MDHLTYKDIINRQRDLIVEPYSRNTLNIPALYDEFLESYSYNKAKILLENWQELSSNEDIAIDKTLNVFSQVVKNDNVSNIKNAASIIEGRTVKKFRNAKQTRHLNNYKLGKFKIQNTKVLNHTKDNESAVNKAKANGGHLGNSLHPHWQYQRDIYGRRLDKMKDQKSDGGEEQAPEENIQAAEECVNSFLHTAWVNEQCDRVLTNHNRLIKRFDLESKVRQCAYTESVIKDCIYGICDLINGYDLPFGIRYNISLENISYLMNKNCVPVDNSVIVEAVTNYYLMQDIDDNKISDMGYILSNSKFFSEDDLDAVSYLYTDEDTILEAYENEDEFEYLEEGKKGKKPPLKKFIAFKKKKKEETTEKENKVQEGKIKKAIHDFKLTHPKTTSALENCIARVFVNSPQNIINGLPDIFDIIRICVAIGLFALNPIIGAIATITGKFLKMDISRSHMDKVITQYEKERDLYKKKMDEAKTDKDKEKYKKLYDQYKKDIDKLNSYADELYTDKEREKREEERYAKEYENMDDSDWDDFDDDFNFDENTMIGYADCISSLTESIVYTKDDIMQVIKSNISKLDTEDIYNLTEAVSLCNDIFDCKEYVNILEDERLRLKTSNVINYQKVDALRMCIDDINDIKYDNLLEEYTLDDLESIPYNLIYEEAKCKYEVLTDTLELISRYNNPLLMEASDGKNGMSLTSKLKIAMENLKRGGHKLKDKEKKISYDIDMEAGRFAKAAKNAMTNDRREAVIKGQLLPSASKTIKLALTAGGVATFFGPVYAIIGILGYIGCSKHLNDKERNLILDDIDIEIEMCDKYLRTAEDNQDLVAQREILKTKRDLQRQRSRILYNKKFVIQGKSSVNYNPKSYDKRYHSND